jgi:hypothetical protein
LNFSSSGNNLSELHWVAFIGVTLQSAILVFGALITYYWKWTKGGIPVDSFAFPLTAAGTTALCLGLYLCAHVIEASTREEIWEKIPEFIPRPIEEDASAAEMNLRKPCIQVVWLQKGQNFGDAAFRPMAIFPSYGQQVSQKDLHMLRTSHRTAGTPLQSKLLTRKSRTS